MKELNQIILDKYKEGNFKSITELFKQIAKEWLTQKQEGLDVNWSGAANGYREDEYTAAQSDMIDILLGDIDEQ